jgi:hypothetical protein
MEENYLNIKILKLGQVPKIVRFVYLLILQEILLYLPNLTSLLTSKIFMFLIIIKNIRCSNESLFDSHKLDLVSIIY